MSKLVCICAAWLLTVMLAVLLAVLPGSASSPDAILRAVQSDDAAAVARLIRERANVNAREPDGATALAWAAMRSNIAVAELLLKAGADPNLTNETGVSPLSLAITNGSAAIAALLLQKGADPNLARESGEAPGHPGIDGHVRQNSGAVDESRLRRDDEQRAFRDQGQEDEHFPQRHHLDEALGEDRVHRLPLDRLDVPEEVAEQQAGGREGERGSLVDHAPDTQRV